VAYPVTCDGIQVSGRNDANKVEAVADGAGLHLLLESLCVL